MTMQNYNYPQEMIDKTRAMFSANFEQDYINGFYAEKLDLLIQLASTKMGARDFSITVLKFLEKQKYREWTNANFFEHYEPSNKKPRSVLFKDTEQGRQLYLNDNKPEPKQLEQDEMSLLILKNIDLLNEVDDLKAENKQLKLSIKSLQQQIEFLLKSNNVEIINESEVQECEFIFDTPLPEIIGKPVKSISEIADIIYKEVAE